MQAAERAGETSAIRNDETSSCQDINEVKKGSKVSKKDKKEAKKDKKKDKKDKKNKKEKKSKNVDSGAEISSDEGEGKSGRREREKERRAKEEAGSGSGQAEGDEVDELFKNTRFSKKEKKKKEKSKSSKKRKEEKSEDEEERDLEDSAKAKKKLKKDKEEEKVKSSESDSSNDVEEEFQGEFVQQKKFTNKDLQNELFGEKKRVAGADDSIPTTNFLTGKTYSKKFYELVEVRKSLPAWQQKKRIVDLISELQVVVLQGDTGSGKTTQVP